MKLLLEVSWQGKKEKRVGIKRQNTFKSQIESRSSEEVDLSVFVRQSDVQAKVLGASYRYMLSLFGVMVFLLAPVGVLAEEDLQAVAMVAHGKQLFAFSSICNCWDSVDLLGQETTLEHKSGALLAVAVTNFRVLGFSAETGKWDQIKLKGNEEFLSLEAKGTVAVVETNIRALGFGSHKGKWVEASFYLK